MEISSSIHHTTSYQARCITKARDNMTRGNINIVNSRAKAQTLSEMNGVFCCQKINDYGVQCMCTFASKSKRDDHQNSSVHKFPTPDLKSWLHEMHLSGKFAFSLATGSRKNQANFINESRELSMKKCRNYPSQHSEVGHEWYADGCYRKHSKDKFYATEYLKKDLEALFIAGFQTEGPKKGKNKYSPEQALATLKNLKLENGRRKYTYDRTNKCGPLPTKIYIQGWFARRKDKMAKAEREKVRRFENESNNASLDLGDEEERGTDILDIECIGNEFDEIIGNDEIEISCTNYSKENVPKLKDLTVQQMATNKFNDKLFFIKLLEDDDILNNRNRVSYRFSKKKLQRMCTNRMLSACINKDSLVHFLECNDKARSLKSSLPKLTQIIQQHELHNEDLSHDDKM